MTNPSLSCQTFFLNQILLIDTLYLHYIYTLYIHVIYTYIYILNIHIYIYITIYIYIICIYIRIFVFIYMIFFFGGNHFKNIKGGIFLGPQVSIFFWDIFTSDWILRKKNQHRGPGVHFLKFPTCPAMILIGWMPVGWVQTCKLRNVSFRNDCRVLQIALTKTIHPPGNDHISHQKL